VSITVRVIFLTRPVLYILMTLKYILITYRCIRGETTMTKSVKEQIHAQIYGALAGAEFPVRTPADLLAAFPAGAATTCRAGNLTMTAGEAGTLLKDTDFPFKSAKSVADVIVERAGL
jgi:hypothetical protein